MNRTKIIATIGPASSATESLGLLLDAGVDVFRLNFSHGSLEEHAEVFQRIRVLCDERNSNAAIMVDLCGPKIRVGEVKDGSFPIRRGDALDILAADVLGTVISICTNRSALVEEASVGDSILIDDGAVRLRVTEKLNDRLRCTCEVGGKISTRKGINLPDTNLAVSALTEDDRIGAHWAFENGADYVALSFVRNAQDLMELRELMPLVEQESRIVAKIETSHAIEHLDEIIDIADAILVARGDLGVEMDLARLPVLQKRITQKCQVAGKTVIIATQMLQSMVESPTATRAEVSDVANAILDNADCIMLSAETSVGSYAVESVEMMSRIARETESFLDSRGSSVRVDATTTLRPVTTAVAHGATVLSEELGAKMVAVWSRAGNTARLLSKCRLNRPIVAFSESKHVCRRMAMFYGVIPIQLPKPERMMPMLGSVDLSLCRLKLAVPGDLVVVVSGSRLEKAGATNALFIHLVGDVAGSLPEIT